VAIPPGETRRHYIIVENCELAPLSALDYDDMIAIAGR